MIRLAKPWIGDAEERAVAAVLQSGQLVQGEMVARFERAVAALLGRRHALAVSSGTAALQLSLVAIGVSRGDDVLCPALSWPSPAHAVRLTEAAVRFVDVDATEWNTTAEAFAAARTPTTKAAIVIDQFGNPARAREIADALPGLVLIEDAACAIGSRFRNAPCGTLGAISCISLHPRKILTTGEGGLCLTDDDALADRLRILRNHGQHDGDFVEPAGNYRLTEMAGAMGLVQLDRLADIVAKRRAVAARYREALGELLQLQATPLGAESNYQTFGAVLAKRYDRGKVLDKLRERGVEAGRLSYAIHQVGSFATGQDPVALPETERVAGQGIALPLYAQMKDSEVDQVIAAMVEVLHG